jgi:uncharacterized alpha-E superfamily protein
MAILTSCSGYEPYHKQRAGQGDPSVSVADFLIFDPLFPRSVYRCLLECQAAAQAITGPAGNQVGERGGVSPVAEVVRLRLRSRNEAEQTLDELVAWLEGTGIEELLRSGLHEALTSVVNRTHGIGEAIHRTFFDVGPQTPPAPPGSCYPSSVSIEDRGSRIEDSG